MNLHMLLSKMAEHFDGGDLKTAAKLVIFEEYLDAYTTILDKHWKQEKWYVDTHSGTGRTVIDESGVTIDGSALITLEEYQDSFDRFYFYELDRDHFHKLHETITERFGYEFDISPVQTDNEDFLVARSNEPYIRIMQMDSNRGVSFLANESNENHHWFTFVDPKGLTAKRDTLDTLIQRSKMDILVNYQTTGVLSRLDDRLVLGAAGVVDGRVACSSVGAGVARR